MGLPRLVLTIVGMSGLYLYANGTFDGMAGDQKSATFSRAGAKSILVEPREVAATETSLIERVFDYAKWTSTGGSAARGADMTALQARLKAKKSPMHAVEFDDAADTVQRAMDMANEAGIATGSTAFDPYLRARSDATDPIKRLKNNR